jgi:hypothetical protein
MKASELRIGDLVYGLFNDEKDVGWYSKSIEVDIKTLENIQNHKPHKPIPLTEEWLERFGFYYDSVSEFWIDESESVGIELIKGMSKFYAKDIESDLYYHITNGKNVHELQSLFFSITGEELTVKELA